MDELEIEAVAEVELDDPVLVEGLPGVGHVGKLAVDHLLEELNADDEADAEAAETSDADSEAADDGETDADTESESDDTTDTDTDSESDSDETITSSLEGEATLVRRVYSQEFPPQVSVEGGVADLTCTEIYAVSIPEGRDLLLLTGDHQPRRTRAITS